MAGSSRSRRVWTARLAAVATRLLIHLRRPVEPRHPTNARIICRKWKINCISDADHDWAWRRAWCRFLSSALWRHGHVAGRPSWWLGEAISVWHSNAFKVSVCTIKRSRWVVWDVDSILLKGQCSFDVYSSFSCRLLRLSAARAIGCLLHHYLSCLLRHCSVSRPHRRKSVNNTLTLTFDLWPWKPFQHCQVTWWLFMPSFIEIPTVSMEISRGLTDTALSLTAGCIPWKHDALRLLLLTEAEKKRAGCSSRMSQMQATAFVC